MRAMALCLETPMGGLSVGEQCAGRVRLHLVRMLLATSLMLLSGCNNNPWPSNAASANTLYTSVVGRSPRHLDPTASYWNNETAYTYQIYEPLYGYHYLKRPFTLIPKAAAQVVKPTYLDKNGKILPDNASGEQIAESVYDIPIKRGILYQPHPSFAKDEQGSYRYHAMQRGELGDKRSPLEFKYQGTRELVADDFVYALRRHATTRITTPIYGLFSEYVVGLKEYGDLIKREDAKLRRGLDPTDLDKPFLDFRKWPMAGASAPEKYLLRIRIKGKYPQWNYWMAMTFLAPVPWEADKFYAQPGMATNGLSMDTWPVGTGPYMATEYVQDRRHVLKRNPNYRGEPYPCEGMPGDKEAGLLDDCGKTMPFIDTMVLTIDKEGVPREAKFKQGYYDTPVIERSDTGLDYIVQAQDSDEVRDSFKEKGFQLPRFSDVNSYFIAFNMMDPVVGDVGSVEEKLKKRKLRQAISIAIDWAEWSKIFPKDGGAEAQGPLPDGLSGSREGTREGVNPVTHRWVDGKALRRPIEDAKKLLIEAGYPNGRDAVTGQPLVLNYDYYSAPTPETKSRMGWVVKQFAKLGVQLEIRATDNNQFQEKIRKGKHQIFWLGWLADYPDAENFLFLLYGPNGKTRSDGENTSNYENPEFDRLYLQLKSLDDGPEKQAVIDKMVAIAQEDAPWTWGYFPYASSAFQHWVHNAKPAVMIRDMLRYYRIDAQDRVQRTQAWNAAIWWPVIVGLLVVVGVIMAALRSFRRRERLNARGELLQA